MKKAIYIIIGVLCLAASCFSLSHADVVPVAVNCTELREGEVHACGSLLESVTSSVPTPVISVSKNQNNNTTTGKYHIQLSGNQPRNVSVRNLCYGITTHNREPLQLYMAICVMRI